MEWYAMVWYGIVMQCNEISDVMYVYVKYNLLTQVYIIYIYVSINIYIYNYICIYVYIFIYTYIYIYIHTIYISTDTSHVGI